MRPSHHSAPEPPAPEPPHPRTRRRVGLDPEPRSAGRARRVVGEILADARLYELADTARLLVSELVTNAVLHAATPLVLRCEVDGLTLVVEVEDQSVTRPGMRHYDDDALTGRGLGLVEMLATAWGVRGEGAGKSVWFVLRAGAAAQVPVAGDVTAAGAAARPDVPPPSTPGAPADAGSEATAAGEAPVEVSLISLPVELVATTIQHGDSLLRELALASMGSREEGREPTSAHLDLGPVVEAIEQARADGLAVVDATVALPPGSGKAAFGRLSLVEEAERMARAGALLSPAALPEIAGCRHWLLSEIGLQAEGAEPVRWELPPPSAASNDAPLLDAADRQRLDASTVAAVLADASNRILYANAAATDLLGWTVEDLVGQRLVVIVPPRLREAHLAGFGRFLITGQPRLLGRSVEVPALRRDGTEVTVTLRLDTTTMASGEVAFHASLG